MAQNGISILQSVDLRNNYAAWLPNVWAIEVGGFYQQTDNTVNYTGTYQSEVIPYADGDGKTAPCGFADEKIGAVVTSDSLLYNLTLGDEASREVTLCLKGLLYKKNAGVTNLKINDDIAAHPSGVQIANTVSQTIIGKALMPITAGLWGMVYVDLVSQRKVMV